MVSRVTVTSVPRSVSRVCISSPEKSIFRSGSRKRKRADPSKLVVE
jgi:hypothetical protein